MKSGDTKVLEGIVSRMPMYTALLLLILAGLGCSGETWQGPSPLSDKEASGVVEAIVPVSEWEPFGDPRWNDSPLVNAVNFGQYLTIQRAVEVRLLIESPGAMRLRHKIKIGTDLRDWEIVLRRTSFPDDRPFRRAYLLASPHGDPGGAPRRLMGIAFYEGVMLELEAGVEVDGERAAAFETLLTEAADRLAVQYEAKLRSIAEDPRFAGPIPTRPDLPDPDLR